MKYVLVGLMSLLSMSAFAGTLVLTGSIPAATSLVVAPLPASSTLDLTSTATNLQVATVTEANNTVNGYTVKVSSANAGLLKNGSLGSVTYTARYNGTSFVLSTTPVVVTNQGSQSAIVNIGKSVDISYAGQAAPSLMAGSYSDTLTFSISAN